MNDRTALVTGANKGIGKHIARLLAAEGLTVYVGSRDPGRGQRAVEEIGAGARLLVLDVTDPDGIAQAAAQVERLDVLVNNAGISPSLAPPADTLVEEYRRTYETNVFGVVAVTNAFLPALHRSPHPRIVNISSGTASLTWSTNPNPQFPREAATVPPTGRPRPPLTLSPSSTPRHWPRTASRSTRSPPACGPPISTPGPPLPTATRPRPPTVPSAWPCSGTTAPPVASSPGTERPCPGDW